MASETRRSDRMLLTIPLLVEGDDEKRAQFKVSGQTVIINRHGALIHVARPLRIGQRLRIVSLLTRAGAFFRVVGPVSPARQEGGKWGVECEDADDNIWRIHFPPLLAHETADSRGLLECRKCNTAALLPISAVETEVLDTSGILVKACGTCKKTTPWGYAEKQVAMGAPAGESEMLAEAEGNNQRRDRRICLQFPALVRDYYGGVEISQTENVSKGGFCFSSAKPYFIGQGIVVVCPYNQGGQQVEISARVVRQVELQGGGRVLYGVRYEASKV
jgi:hypothetical protein